MYVRKKRKNAKINSPGFSDYVRAWDAKNQKTVYEHRLIWESVHGKIPKGFQIHHKNHIRSDNRIENLELISRKSHSDIHNHISKNECGVRVQACKSCGLTKNRETDFYKRGAKCKDCRAYLTAYYKYKQNKSVRRFRDGRQTRIMTLIEKGLV